MGDEQKKKELSEDEDIFVDYKNQSYDKQNKQRIKEELQNIYVANIAFEKKDGSVVSSIVGYGSDYVNEKGFDGIGKLLHEHYNDEKSALAVSGVGFVSSLYPTIDDIVYEENSVVESQISALESERMWMDLEFLDFSIDSIKKGSFWTSEFSNILEYEKSLLGDSQIGSADDYNFLWTNDSWHYHYYTIEGDIEKHIEQTEEPSIDEDNGKFEDSHENHVIEHRKERWDSYSEYNEIYDEPDLIDRAVEKGEKEAYEAQIENDINEKFVDKMIEEENSDYKEKTYSGSPTDRKWIKLSELLNPEPVNDSEFVKDDIPF